ncbi:MAG: hypothetical protein AB7W16_04555 [Candidatus Obscuribacterales bacterium]
MPSKATSLVDVFFGSKASKQLKERLKEEFGRDSEEVLRQVALCGSIAVQDLSIVDQVERIENLIWIINRLHGHEFLDSPFCLVFKSVEPELFELTKSIWLSYATLAGASAQTLSNTVKAIAPSEPATARKLLKELKIVSTKTRRQLNWYIGTIEAIEREIKGKTSKHPTRSLPKEIRDKYL